MTLEFRIPKLAVYIQDLLVSRWLNKKVYCKHKNLGTFMNIFIVCVSGDDLPW